MLVLTRKQDEKIQIGDSITITVVRTKGKTVRLGIVAPPEMSVLRGELVFDLEDADAETTEDADESSEPALHVKRNAKRKTTRTDGWAIAACQEGASTPANSAAPICVSEKCAPLRQQVAARR